MRGCNQPEGISEEPPDNPNPVSIDRAKRLETLVQHRLYSAYREEQTLLYYPIINCIVSLSLGLPVYAHVGPSGLDQRPGYIR